MKSSRTRRPLILFCGVAALTTLCSADLQAQTPAGATYRVGMKSIAIPSPVADLAETGSDFRVLLEPLTPASNRLIAAFVSAPDLKALQTEPTITLSTYALAETARRLEFVDLTPDLFTQLTDTMNQQFGAIVESSIKDAQDDVNKRMKSLNLNATVTLEKPAPLGSLFAKTDEAGYGVVLPVSTNGTTRNMVSGVILVRVQNRLLFGYFYTPFKDDSTIAFVRATTEHWADAILVANH